MRDVAIIGVGMIPFGRRDEDTLLDMLAYASLNALDDANLKNQKIDAVYIANMGAGILQHKPRLPVPWWTASASCQPQQTRSKTARLPVLRPSRTVCWPWLLAIMRPCW